MKGAEKYDPRDSQGEDVPVKGDVEAVQQRRVLVIWGLEGGDGVDSSQAGGQGHHPTSGYLHLNTNTHTQVMTSHIANIC